MIHVLLLIDYELQDICQATIMHCVMSDFNRPPTRKVIVIMTFLKFLCFKIDCIYNRVMEALECGCMYFYFPAKLQVAIMQFETTFWQFDELFLPPGCT